MLININKAAILEEATALQKDPEKLKKMAARDKLWGHDPKMTKECQGIGKHYRVCGGCINDLRRKYKNDPAMLRKIDKAKKINQDQKAKKELLKHIIENEKSF